MNISSSESKNELKPAVELAQECIELIKELELQGDNLNLWIISNALKGANNK